MAACRMNEEYQHIPVLLKEAVAALITDPNGVYVDATFGRGSHSRAILAQLGPSGRLIAFDKDPEAVQHARDMITDERFCILHSSFARMQLCLQNLDLFEKVQGILFDLGVSSPQLDNPERGFSFVREGKLDMRMDTSQGESAAQWLAIVAEKELADVLWQYGEEKFSRRIARAIVEKRAESPITTTKQLASIIAANVPRSPKEKKHPATRSFQAIRIYINRELLELEQALEQALACLKVGGRLAVISFHSLEDRIAKQFVRKHEKGEELPPGLPIKHVDIDQKLKSLGKAVKPSEQEIDINPRARSAILRIAEKQS